MGAAVGHPQDASPTKPGAASQHGAPGNAGQPLDRFHRPLRELRISVTDRCNFRCRYCMPREVFDHHRYLPRSAYLTVNEIERLARVFVRLGVHKLRLTGGEPLLRRDLPELVARLARLRTPQGTPVDLCLTTNGVLLPAKAQALAQAGLRRVTISLDALDDTVFRRMADTDQPVSAVLAGIAAAQHAGLAIKLNMVVQRGVNDAQVLPMARHFRGQGLALRFIEYMDVGSTNGWRLDQVVPSAELLDRLRAEFALRPVGDEGPVFEAADAMRLASPDAPRDAVATPRDTAERWLHVDAQGHHQPQLGELGFISAVTQAFCAGCTRLRLSTDGQLFTCLFAATGTDLGGLLRGGANDGQLAERIRQTWQRRDDRYSALRQPGLAAADGPARVEMSYIGG
ncbi:cyclic pyranopterin phosphate synthase [Comamonas serinivorans]|uniref:GTP 3',8-cyclase n=2 Tax=Comamonas serinivorans TaxID=1082851 RepID=A0A1Y0ESX8_9BURK|nr:cyclic pyranopterin phosphate synthase [Comamonas serinivorans]